MAFNPDKCMKLKALEDSCQISLPASRADSSKHFQFSKDGVSWVNDSITLNKDETCYVKGVKYPRGSTFAFTGLVEIVGGNVMSLADDGAGESTDATVENEFMKLFDGCANLTAICPNFLPATKVGTNSYNQMFCNCIRLEVVPEGLFPENVTFSRRCYSYMFEGCTALKEIHVAFHSWTPEDESFYRWVNYVAPNGKFYCPEDLPKEYGNNRIPSGWKVNPPSGRNNAASINFLNKHKIGGRKI